MMAQPCPQVQILFNGEALPDHMTMKQLWLSRWFGKVGVGGGPPPCSKGGRGAGAEAAEQGGVQSRMMDAAGCSCDRVVLAVGQQLCAGRSSAVLRVRGASQEGWDKFMEH